MEDKQSGLSITGQVRDIVSLPTKQYPSVLFIRNDDYPVQVKLNK
jgi:hypothetical protein